MSSAEALNISLTNHFHTKLNVTVTLQWPREAGAVYNVSIKPQISNTELFKVTSTVTANLTLSYNIQYNVSIVSSLCGVITTKVLYYGKPNKILQSCY